MKEKISLETLKNFLTPKEMQNIFGGSTALCDQCDNEQTCTPPEGGTGVCRNTKGVGCTCASGGLG